MNPPERPRTTAGLLRQWERDRFTQLGYIDQRTQIELDGHLLAAAAVTISSWPRSPNRSRSTSPRWTGSSGTAMHSPTAG